MRRYDILNYNIRCIIIHCLKPFLFRYSSKFTITLLSSKHKVFLQEPSIATFEQFPLENL
jgi:hypothetical protein